MILTVASWPAYTFLKKEVRWPGIHISSRIFHSLWWSTQSKTLGSQWNSSRCFLEFSCFFFFYDPMDVGNLVCGSFVLSKSSLNIWKFSVHILLESGLENFEHSFASVWDGCNFAVVWTFFGIAFLWNWSQTWVKPYPSHLPSAWLQQVI